MTSSRHRAVGISLTAEETYAVVVQLDDDLAGGQLLRVVEVVGGRRGRFAEASPESLADDLAALTAQLGVGGIVLGGGDAPATSPMALVCLDRDLVAAPATLRAALVANGLGPAVPIGVTDVGAALLHGAGDRCGLLVLPATDRSVVAIDLRHGEAVGAVEFTTAAPSPEWRWHPGDLAAFVGAPGAPDAPGAGEPGGQQAGYLAFARSHPAVDARPSVFVGPGQGLATDSPTPVPAAGLAFGAALCAAARLPTATARPVHGPGERTLQSPLLPPGVTLDMVPRAASSQHPPGAHAVDLAGGPGSGHASSGGSRLEHGGTPGSFPPGAEGSEPFGIEPGPTRTARSLRRAKVVTVAAALLFVVLFGGVAATLGDRAAPERSAAAVTPATDDPATDEASTGESAVDGTRDDQDGGDTMGGTTGPTVLIPAGQAPTRPSLPPGRSTAGSPVGPDGAGLLTGSDGDADTVAGGAGPDARPDAATSGDVASGDATVVDGSDGSGSRQSVTGSPDARYEQGRAFVQAAAPDPALAQRWNGFLVALVGADNVDRAVPTILGPSAPLRLAVDVDELFLDDGTDVSSAGDAVVAQIVRAATESGATSMAIGLPQGKAGEGRAESYAVSRARAAALEAAFARHGATAPTEVVDLSRQIGRRAPVLVAIDF